MPRLTLKLMTSTAQLSRNIASILQEQLRAVGIGLELESLELPTLFDRINKAQFDLYYLRSIGANQSTDIFQFVYHSRYQNPEFNDLIAQLRADDGSHVRMAPMFNRLEEILAPASDERAELATIQSPITASTLKRPGSLRPGCRARPQKRSASQARALSQGRLTSD